MRTIDYNAKRAADLVGNTTNAQLFVRADNAAKDVVLAIPAGSKVVRIVAGGTATGNTTTNFTGTVYWGDATTTALAATAANAYNSASGGWHLDVIVQLDAVNSKIHGYKSGWSGSTPTVLAQTILTDVTSVTTLDNKLLAVGCTFSASDAGNKATLDYFNLEVISQAK